MRDKDTTTIAIQAALSGHRVLSSMHAMDTVSTIFRLLEQQVEPYLLNAALYGIVAQRLLRRLCPTCIAEREPTAQERAIFAAFPQYALPPVARYGKGCNQCNNTGYRGRQAIYEILTLNDALRDAITQHASPQALLRIAQTTGYTTLWDHAMAQVVAGHTTIAEVLRVLSDVQLTH
jgi:type II secretory ATPase GspE/PulE/Tfp pilus assembly ATPase PilB-like protein